MAGPRANGNFTPYASALLTTAVAFTLYLLTMPRQLTLANFGTDGGELITAAVTLGVAHPPGYPTYVLLGKAASWLPVGSVAFRFHLLSGLSAALAAGLVADWLRRMYDPTTAVAAALTLAFAPLVWSQAIIAEVYAPALLFMALTLWSFFTQRPGRLTGLLFGLATTFHLTAVLMLPLILLDEKRPSLPPFFGGLLPGLLPWLLPIWLARGDSPVIWGDPTTLSGWWWLVSAQLYSPNLFGLPVTDWWPRLQSWLPRLLAQFTWAGLPLLLFAGFRPAPNGRRRRWLLLATAVIYLLYAFTYLPPDALVLTLPAWLLLSVLLAPALQTVGKWAAVLPLALVLLHFSQSPTAPAIGPQATALLNSLPPTAVLETPGDETIFVLWYTQHVERVRPDVALVDANLFAFNWYRQRLPQTYPDLATPAADNLAALRQQQAGKRPYCTASIHNPTPLCTGLNQP